METNIFRSKKFLVMLVDVIVSLIMAVGGWYLAPEALDKIVTIIGILQAPIIFLIGAIAYEDAAAINRGLKDTPELIQREKDNWASG